MNTIQKIVDLFSEDNGMQYDLIKATALWDALDKKDQEFLESLSDEDLANITQGEVRLTEDDREIWLFQGEWRELPPGVHDFLNILFEECV